MEIKIAKYAGTCFGVDNAIKKTFETIKENNNKNIYIIGELVHNPFVVEKLSKEGLIKINNIQKLKKDDYLIIRAHGEQKKVYDYCNKNKINIIDCTCPFVLKAQKHAQELENKKYQVVIVGDSNHPEVRGIVAQTKNAIVISNPKDAINKIKKNGKIGILSQTTQTRDNFSETIASIISYGKTIKIYNTICDATEKRQFSAKKLAKNVDLMIIIGGKNSSNTEKLYNICSKIVKSYWINSENELKKEWFININKVGITAGASTPKELINKIHKKIKTINNLND
jgi:4-hydroxy-3-methylbut-2-en-1-yl diphosphate reductase